MVTQTISDSAQAVDIQWVNLTTRLPIGRDLAADITQRLAPEFVDLLRLSRVASRGRREVDAVRVLLLNANDYKKSRPPKIGLLPSKPVEDEPEDCLPNPDALAYFSAHHWRLHRPAIVMSPEKLLNVLAESLIPACGSSAPGEVSSALDLYPEVLAKVAIHELAHAAMSAEAHMPCSGDMDWAAVARAIDDGDVIRGTDALSAANAFSHDHQCNWTAARRLPRGLQADEHWVEESLANAFALSHFPTGRVRHFLEAWVEQQPPAYKAGLLWRMDIGDLVQAGAAWARLKARLARLDAGDPTMRAALTNLANELRNGNPVERVPNFGN